MSSRMPVLDSAVLGERFEVLASPKPFQGYFVAPGRDVTTDQEVMVRLIPLAELEKTGSVLSCQQYLDRAGRLTHKNIARVMGYGRSNGVLYVVDEHVPGHRLGCRPIQRFRLPKFPDEAICCIRSSSIRAHSLG